MYQRLPIVCSLGLLAVLFTSCSNANSYDGNSYTTVEAARPKTAEELRAELLQREESAPTEFLQVNGTHHRNLIDQLVLEGDITSQATLARFKDPVLSVTWYSQTETELSTHEYPIYEIVQPQGTTHYKLKTNAPSEVATVSIGISDATPIK
ncbi:hypothetical protein GCM10027594_12740 [Hymenobacter agri]